jgi:hypothetical protein
MSTMTLSQNKVMPSDNVNPGSTDREALAISIAAPLR